MGLDSSIPQFSEPHPHLAASVHRNIIESEVLGGVYFNDVPAGTVLEVETENRSYRIVRQGLGQALISGHPQYCPEPILVHIHGSTWGGPMIKQDFIGRGMHLEFSQPELLTVTTSRIVEIREIP